MNQNTSKSKYKLPSWIYSQGIKDLQPVNIYFLTHKK